MQDDGLGAVGPQLGRDPLRGLLVVAVADGDARTVRGQRHADGAADPAAAAGDERGASLEPGHRALSMMPSRVSTRRRIASDEAYVESIP